MVTFEKFVQIEWPHGWPECLVLIRLTWNTERYLQAMEEREFQKSPSPGSKSLHEDHHSHREKSIRKAIRIALDPKSLDRRVVQKHIGAVPSNLDERLPGLSGKYKHHLDISAVRSLNSKLTEWFIRPDGLLQCYLDSDIVNERKEKKEEVFSTPLDIEYMSKFVQGHFSDFTDALYFVLDTRRLHRKHRNPETHDRAPAMFDKLQKEYLLPESKGDLRKYGVAVHPILLEHVSIKVEDPEAAMQLALKNSTHFGDVVCSAKGEGATLTILGEDGHQHPITMDRPTGVRVEHFSGKIHWTLDGVNNESDLVQSDTGTGADRQRCNYVIATREHSMFFSDTVTWSCYHLEHGHEHNERFNMLGALKRDIVSKVFGPLIPQYTKSEEYEELLERKAIHSGEQFMEAEKVDLSEVTKKGLLHKQGEGFGAWLRWRWRFFVLARGGGFAYYADEDAYDRGDKPLGTINTQHVTNLICKDGVGMEVVTPKRTFHLKTETNETRQEWLQAMVDAGLPRDVCIDDIDVLHLIGAGANGKVAEVRDTGTAQKLAMKVLPLDKILEGRGQLTAERVAVERQLLLELDHPYLVKGHSAFQKGNKLYMCMEFASGGDLWHHMYENKDCPLYKPGSAKAVILGGFYTSQVVCALGALHMKDILYADLKPENIVVDGDGHIKITDFGLCRTNVESYTAQDGLKCFTSEGGSLIGGTPEYYAPELLLTREKGPIGKALDWWTLGILAFEMIHKITPFRKPKPSRDTDYRAIVKGTVLTEFAEFPGLPSTAKDFIDGLLTVDASKRLGSGGTSEVKKHPYFSSVCDFTQTWAQFELRAIEPPWRPAVADHFGDARKQLERVESVDMAMKSEEMTTASGQVDDRRLSTMAPELAGFAFNRSGSKATGVGGQESPHLPAHRRATMSGGEAEKASEEIFIQPGKLNGSQNLTWQLSSGRKDGSKDGYVFGDVTRTAIKKVGDILK